jgi:hypothetical protein
LLPIRAEGDAAMRHRALLAAVLVVLVGAAVAHANKRAVPPPVPKPASGGTQEVKLVVAVDDTVKVPRLLVPRSLLTAEKKTADAGSRVPTMMAGIALTAAFVSGGLWLVRRSGNRKVAGVVLMLSVATFGASALYADRVPGRPPVHRPTTLPLPAGVALPEKLTLEIAEKGDAVKLIISSKMKVSLPTAASAPRKE